MKFMSDLRFMLSTLSFIILSGLSYGQKKDTTFYNVNWEKSSKENSEYYRITIEEGIKYLVTDYFKSGAVQMTGTLLSLTPEVKDGLFVFYHKNGRKKYEATYQNGIKLSVSPEWDENGFEMIELDKEPTFPGGTKKLYKYLAANFNYPKHLKSRQKGVIQISFVVDKEGGITDVTTLNTVHPLLDTEAIRVVSGMPKWEPGIVKEKPVRVKYTIPFYVD